MPPSTRGKLVLLFLIYQQKTEWNNLSQHSLTVSFSFSSCSICSLLNCALAVSKSNSPSNFSWGGGGGRTGRFPMSPRGAKPPRGIPPRMLPRNIIPPKQHQSSQVNQCSSLSTKSYITFTDTSFTHTVICRPAEGGGVVVKLYCFHITRWFHISSNF